MFLKITNDSKDKLLFTSTINDANGTGLISLVLSFDGTQIVQALRVPEESETQRD